MHVIRPPDIPASEITPEAVYLRRREFLAGAGAAAWAAFPLPLGLATRDSRPGGVGRGGDEPTPYEDVTGYNNFYEFGTDKEDPKRNAHTLRPRPWTVEVAGEVKRPARYALDDLLKPHKPVERTYRLRCVEGWSMVIPWLGIPFRDIIARLEPTSRAKYVEFTTLLDPEQMPGQRSRVLPWPYVEGLRMDEAMHPLTLMVTGLYGKPLPNQNGAPLRLMVPWKYGFKSGKSLVRIRFTEQQPRTTWNMAAPD